MRHFFFKIIVSITTFFFGVLIATIFLVFEKPERRKLTQEEVITTKITPEPEQIIQPITQSFNKKTLSPYNIEEFINSNPRNKVEEIWEKLKIPNIYHGTPINSQDSDFFIDCNDCKAETFKLELDGQPNSEILLKIQDPWRENCRYLVFKHKTKNRWQLLGYIDHNFGRYEMPKHFTLLSGGKNWLVVRVQVGSGSGFALYYERLFAIINNKVAEILEYPADGHVIGFPNRDFSARIIDCKIENNTIIVKVEFSITYSTFNDTSDDLVLWKKKQRAVFRKNLDSKKVIFDTKNSNLSQQEMKSVYGFEESTNEELVKYNFGELKKISLGKDVNQKQWLQEFLQLCKPTRETKILQRNLSK